MDGEAKMLSAKVYRLNTGAAMLARLRRAGFVLSLGDGGVELKTAPRARMTDAIKKFINRHSVAMVRALLREETARAHKSEPMDTYDEMMDVLDGCTPNHEAPAGQFSRPRLVYSDGEKR